MDKIQKINRTFYDKNAASWAVRKGNPFFQEENFRQFVKYFKPGNLVLDIGCAAGNHVPMFLGIGRKLKYEGLDLSPKLLKIGKSRYPQLPFHKGSLLSARSLPRKKYHGFWASAILQHIPLKQWPLAIENLKKITRKNGVGYITVPKTRPMKQSKNDNRYFELFTKAKFLKIAKEQKLKILKSGQMISGNDTQWFWLIVRL